MTLEVHLVVPGRLTRISGGSIYDRRIMQGLRDLGHRLVVHELSGQFPLVGEEERRAAAALLPAMAKADRVVIDGLALPAFDRSLDRLPQPWVALVHHPLALEGGLPAERTALLEARERRMLARARRVIVTSRQTVADVRRLGVGLARIGVVEPGTDPRPLAAATGEPPTLLVVGAVIPRKGQDLLLEALAGLTQLTWRLRLIGDIGRDHAMTRRIRDLITSAGMRERVRLEGEVAAEQLANAYATADLFVLPSHHEGYGMALAEALAHGLPVVSTRAGAIPDTIFEGAGLLVPPGDIPALREALRRLLTDRAFRLRLRDRARVARQGLGSWADAARTFAGQLEAMPG